MYESPFIFNTHLQQNDVCQGKFGNSYFTALLSTLAEDPERVKNLFYTQEYNSAGIFLVIFKVNGILTPVTVDDYFPVDF